MDWDWVIYGPNPTRMIQWVNKFDHGSDLTRSNFLLGWIWVQYQDPIKKSDRVGITQNPVQPDPFAGLHIPRGEFRDRLSWGISFGLMLKESNLYRMFVTKF